MNRPINYCFEYDLRQRVTIVELDRPGIVDAIGVFDSGVQYRIVYWNNGERKSEWMYPIELELK